MPEQTLINQSPLQEKQTVVYNPCTLTATQLVYNGLQKPPSGALGPLPANAYDFDSVAPAKQLKL